MVNAWVGGVKSECEGLLGRQAVDAQQVEESEKTRRVANFLIASRHPTILAAETSPLPRLHLETPGALAPQPVCLRSAIRTSLLP